MWACDGSPAPEQGEQPSAADGEKATENVGNIDSDGDGLADHVEAAFGSDPQLPDTDGDGLTDFEEHELGSDPTSEDSDNDLYHDLDEVLEGTDPTDASSVIYDGGWPYVRHKDDVTDPGFEQVPGSGDRFVRFRGADQFGQGVDLYDFLDEDKPVMIDISAPWCGACLDISSWLAHGDPTYDALYPGVRDAVDAGELRWITIVGEAMDGQPADPQTVATWHDVAGHEQIPVLADQSDVMLLYVGSGTDCSDTFPSLTLLSPGLVVAEGGQGPTSRVLEVAAGLF